MENGMATHHSIRAWRSSWREEMVGYSPWGSKELDTTKQLTPKLPEKSWLRLMINPCS